MSTLPHSRLGIHLGPFSVTMTRVIQKAGTLFGEHTRNIKDWTIEIASIGDTLLPALWEV